MRPKEHITGFPLFSLFFLFISISDLMAVAFYPSLRWCTKPLIMISLIVYYYYASQRIDKLRLGFLIALVAAFIGDIFLLFNGENYFIFGLASFLIMQMIYIITFYKDSFHFSNIRIFLAAILLGIFGFYMNILWPSLHEMSIPVTIYSLIIVMMSLSALFRPEYLKGYAWVFIGSLLFIISDGFIAWNKFMTPVAYGGLIVMSTYILAQYLIVMGMLGYAYSTKSE